MSKVDGIATLEELPEKEIFVEIESQTINKIKNKIKVLSSIKKFSKRIGSSSRIINHWLRKESLLRLDIFKRLIRFFGMNVDEIKIISLRSKTGKKIRNPRLPFNFKTRSGVRVIAGILGDGSLNKKSLFYSNFNEDLIEGFTQDAKNVFGDLEPTIRSKSDNPDVKIVELPFICGKIINKLGIETGPKVLTNPHIPPFVFDLDEKTIIEFISQIFDDEGNVNIVSKHIGLRFAVDTNQKCSNIINDIRKLLLKLGIDSSIYREEKYTSSRGPDRRRWKIQIHSFLRLRRLYSILNLKSEKREDFKNLLKSQKLSMFPIKKCKEIYFSAMKEIEKENGFFTSEKLFKRIDRSLGHTRNMIRKYRCKGLIKIVEDVRSDGRRFYPAKYKVIK